MSKKRDNNMNKFLTMMEQEGQQVEYACSMFYPDGTISPDLIYTSDPEASKKILDKLCWLGSSPQPDVKSLKEQCLKIQEKALSGEDDQAIVSLDLGKLIIHNQSYKFGNTLIKVQSTASNTSPAYIFFKEGSTLLSRIYLSNSNSDGVMAILNEENEEVFIRLAECHVLSIQEKSEARREIGLMLSFTRAIRHVYFSIIMALNLDPIKNLLLSEWLTSECEKAKEGNMPVCSTLGLEGDSDKDEKI